MEANLVAGEVAKTERKFPYTNWGPWVALLGVVVALFVGLVLSLPALLVGNQEGHIEALFPGGQGSASFDKGDATAIAIDNSANRFFTDHEDEVRTFGALGDEIAKARITGLEDSHGLAYDQRDGTLYISEKSPGRILADAPGTGKPRPLRAGVKGFEPERIAVSPLGVLWAIDTATDQVLGLPTANGGPAGRLQAPGGSFDFGSEDNGIAVAPNGTVYVLSGKGDGTAWAFSPAGALRWELKPESGDEFAALSVDEKGNLWIAEPNGDTYEYTRGGSPGRTAAKLSAGSSPSAIAFAGSGHVFVARELDGTLTTLGSVLSQFATELGFLLVPMAICSMRGAAGLRRILERLGFRAFKPSALGWMALAFALYLAFTIFYSVLITEPKQKDIAESFGPTVVQVLLIVIAAPIAEETCFRGMLFGGLREKLPRIAAALVCGLVFGALHALTGVTAVPPLIVFGFLLALLYEKTGSIIPGILLHMLNNSIALLSQ